jgi:hypothetical protein
MPSPALAPDADGRGRSSTLGGDLDRTSTTDAPLRLSSTELGATRSADSRPASGLRAREGVTVCHHHARRTRTRATRQLHHCTNVHSYTETQRRRPRHVWPRAPVAAHTHLDGQCRNRRVGGRCRLRRGLRLARLQQLARTLISEGRESTLPAIPQRSRDLALRRSFGQHAKLETTARGRAEEREVIVSRGRVGGAYASIVVLCDMMNDAGMASGAVLSRATIAAASHSESTATASVLASRRLRKG